MKRTITLQINQNDLDNVVLNELKDALYLVLQIERDEGGEEIEPDHEVIFGLLETIKYFMPFHEIDDFMNTLMQEQEYFKKYTLALDVISTI